VPEKVRADVFSVGGRWLLICAEGKEGLSGGRGWTPVLGASAVVKQCGGLPNLSDDLAFFVT
jgi:hypothetical protein